MANIYWVRNDLRLSDNWTLNCALENLNDLHVVWTPTKSYQRAVKFRKEFIDCCVSSFGESLKQLNLNFSKQQISFPDYLFEIIKYQKVEKIFATQEFAFEEVNQEKQIKKICEIHGIDFILIDQQTLVLQKHLPFELKQMPYIFTDYRKQTEFKVEIQNPRQFDLKEIQSFRPGPMEQKALDRLNSYLWQTHSAQTYKETRNGLLNENDSSRFSPWLSLGVLSARQIYHELKKYEQVVVENESTYWLYFELQWRDYFKFLSRKYQKSIFLSRGIRAHNTHFEYDSNIFEKWTLGKTGCDFVDANMIELKETGWMSNRGRQNVASFLIHDLKQPWILGAAYFEKMLIDYDPDSNWGNWLYLSGNGTDPRFRKFNIERQAEMYDPDKAYRRKWLQERNS